MVRICSGESGYIGGEVKELATELELRLREIAHRKVDELFDEVLAEFGGRVDSGRRSSDVDTVSEDASGNGAHGWSLDDGPLRGGWEEVSRSPNETYGWPDGSVDLYEDFVTYRGSGDFAGMTLGLGYKDNGDVVGFVLDEGQSKRGLIWFFPTDDFPESNEMISMIRGGGPRKRSGFGRDVPLPKAYSGVETAPLSDRKAGKWNVQGVVAKADDYETMLRHTAIQARLRELA